MTYEANTLHTSASKKFVVEIKKVDTEAEIVSTVTYERDAIGLRMIANSMAETVSEIKKFLEKN
jgi:hypothetical protein